MTWMLAWVMLWEKIISKKESQGSLRLLIAKCQKKNCESIVNGQTINQNHYITRLPAR